MGLTTAEARSRLTEFGSNAVVTQHRVRLLRRIGTQLRDPMILLLLAAVILTVSVGDLTDALVIAMVIVVNTTVGLIQDSPACEPLRRPASAAEAESNLQLLGLVGIADTPKPLARATIAAFRTAGITPILITGDHPATAGAIATEVGITARPDEVVDGRQLASDDHEVAGSSTSPPSMPCILPRQDTPQSTAYGDSPETSLELAPHQIWVNAIAPGGIAIPGVQQAQAGSEVSEGVDMNKLLEAFLGRIPMARMGEPDDSARSPCSWPRTCRRT